jgi:iron(II)-dependent oxidoreductase
MKTAAAPRKSPATLMDRLADARARTDELFALVRPEAVYDRPIPERHRIIFYIGHLEAFDWNLIGRRVLGLEPFDADFDKLFAFGIDPVGGGLPTDQPSDWPAREVVDDYCRRVREKLDAKLAGTSLGEDAPPELRGGLALEVIIEHRLMHAETLAYMLHQLPLDGKYAQPGAASPAAPPVVPRRVPIPAGRVRLGHAGPAAGVFGWDNEFPERISDVGAFEIDVYPVTNRQYLEFIADGGYRNPALWSEEDWQWIQSSRISHPGFWIRRDGEWFWRAMFAEIPLPLEAPVYVSHAEASAYARWSGSRLPTEEEWQRAAHGTASGPERSYPWGETPPTPDRGNFDFQRWDPTPVTAHPAGASAFSVMDILGNGWEWTATVFDRYPGFEPFPFYPGYSADFFDGKHYVMRGGSARTAACMLRRTFRNWFQAHYPHMYAKFRTVARDAADRRR